MSLDLSTIQPYIPDHLSADFAVVIFPGGGYCFRADHEGDGYARFFRDRGIASFVVDYRVSPHHFPAPLLDARRAVRYVRAHAAEFGIDPQKIAVMGSSAGGHLTALVSTYTAPLDGETADGLDTVDFLPNAQILCYPVVCSPESGVAHIRSYENLLGNPPVVPSESVDPCQLATEATPPAFIWHTDADQTVNVLNSYRYATRLHELGVPTELHVFPHGGHGLGMTNEIPHVQQWCELLLNWLSLSPFETH